jgi:hypothetical protein
MAIIRMVWEYIATTPDHHFDISGEFDGSVVGEFFSFEVSHYIFFIEKVT